MTPQRQPGCNTEYIRIFSKQSTKDPIFEINPIFGLLPVFFGGDFFLFFRGFLSELFGIFSQQYLISDYSPNNIQRIQFWECILLTHGADMRRINMDFSIFVFSDDKIVDNVFVFSAPFYFHCPIGHVILKTWHVCPKVWMYSVTRKYGAFLLTVSRVNVLQIHTFFFWSSKTVWTKHLIRSHSSNTNGFSFDRIIRQIFSIEVPKTELLGGWLDNSLLWFLPKATNIFSPCEIELKISLKHTCHKILGKLKNIRRNFSVSSRWCSVAKSIALQISLISDVLFTDSPGKGKMQSESWTIRRMTRSRTVTSS